jgi:hypothetical protein
MAYDRYENRHERSPDYNRPGDRGDFRSGRHDERGFFERAGDEIASWFGDDEAERRRRQDERMNRDHDRGNNWTRGRDYDRGYGRDVERDRGAFRGSSGDLQRNRDQDRNRSQQPRSTQDWDRYGYSDYDRDTSPRGYGYSPPVQGYGPAYVGGTGYTGGFGYNYGAGESYGSSGYGGSFGHGNEGRDRDRERDRERDPDRERERERSYRPMAGDYGRSGTPWARDDYRNTSYAGSSRDNDRHYHAWRQRQLDELDHDYDRYHRERQERFENDFGTWRQNRMGKRQRLGMIHEHMDVVGSDGDTVGKVDCVKGDHIVLTKGDSPDNRHHAIDCSMIETVEGDQVRLDIPAEEAKSRWEDAGDGDHGFFGRGEASDRDRENRNEETNLNRSFSGTYES